MTERILSGKAILLVEDEYFIVDDLIRACKAVGADIVGPAATIDDALGLIKHTARLDAAMLDVNLQGEMAYPVADALIARGVPFVFATGYDKPFLPARYAHIPLHEKPLNPVEIARTLFA